MTRPFGSCDFFGLLIYFISHDFRIGFNDTLVYRDYYFRLKNFLLHLGFPVEEYYARLEWEEAVPELAWRSLQQPRDWRAASQSRWRPFDRSCTYERGIQKTSASIPRWLDQSIEARRQR
jgi:hypothetical protein